MSDTRDRLIAFFKHFPGIGPRQAERFVYFLLRQDPDTLAQFSRLVSQLKGSVRQCGRCFRFFSIGNFPVCAECADESRDHSLLLVLEKDADFDAVRRSGHYTGLYFILGGLLTLLDDEPPPHLRMRELERRVNDANGEIKEIIIALAANREGDYTAQYIKDLLASYALANGLTITTLGRGLSTGLELEYSDPDTIKNALKNRE